MKQETHLMHLGLEGVAEREVAVQEEDAADNDYILEPGLCVYAPSHPVPAPPIASKAALALALPAMYNPTELQKHAAQRL